MSRVGRPPGCTCGECSKCKRAAYMRGWWQRQSDAKKREYLDARMERRGDEIREFDRQRYANGRRPSRAPEKARTVGMVQNALKRGHLVKQPCEVCGVEKVDAHHEDYSKPLDVRWLCRKHHMELHRKYHAAEAA